MARGRPEGWRGMTTALVASRGRLPDWLWGWACDKCGATFPATGPLTGVAKEAVERCCAFACKMCGCATPNHHTMCNDCRSEDRLRREVERLEAAPLVDWDGPVWVDDRYFSDTFTAADEGHTGRAWVCVPVPLRLDASVALEAAISEHHEDANDDIGEDAEMMLQCLLDCWAEPFAELSWAPGDKATMLPDAEGEQ